MSVSFDDLSPEGFSALMAPLFEAAPRFIGRLEADRPFGSWDELFERAARVALEMPAGEQLELIDAHPRIGAPPGSVSPLSYVEQGYDTEAASIGAETERTRMAAELERLNDAYESRFGFRYVIFVAGRSRSEIVPLLTAALDAEADAERTRALRDVVDIARARAIKTGLMTDHTNAE